MSEAANNMEHLHPLSWVFDQKLYRIPDYQRGYSWGAAQWNDLWNDLFFLDENRNHYTGLLSVKPMERSPLHGYQAFQVVDGQQRLTTCVILLNALIRKAEEIDPGNAVIGTKSVHDIRSDYIVRTNRDAGSVLLLDYGKDDNETSRFFRYRILGIGEPKESKDSLYTRNLEMADQFFAEKIQELCSGDEVECRRWLESIFAKLTGQLTFNFFAIPDNNEVYEVFESMNNRGKPLSDLEILKNRLLYLLTLYNITQLPEERAECIHNNIVSTWKTIYEWLGKKPDRQLSDDALLRDHWVVCFEYVRRNGEDYFQFLQNEFSKQAVYRHKQRYIPDQPEYDPKYAEEENNKDPIPHDGYLEPVEIEKYVESLGTIAPYWYYTYYPDDYDYLDPEEKEWLKKLNDIDMAYFRPLVAVAIIRRNNVSKEQRMRLLKAIERFIFVIFRMCNYRFDYQSAEYRKDAHRLFVSKDPATIDQISEKLENTTEQLKQSSVEWFVSIIDNLFTSRDGFYSWGGLRYFLLEYESMLAVKNRYHVDKVLRGRISIEHIYPQTPTDEYWKNQFGRFDDKQRQMLTGSLGNLLPLELGTNSGLQNVDFYRKKAVYDKGSHSEHEVAEKQDWGPEEIYKRGMNLLDFLSDRWKLALTEEVKKDLLHIEFIHDLPEHTDPQDASNE